MARDMADTIKGSVWGLAAGDALGATVEFMSRDEVARKHGLHTEITGGGWLKLQPGEFTDDTEMMLATALGIGEDPLNPEPHVGKRFIQWYRSHPPDIGTTVRSALALYLTTGSWEQAGAITEDRFRPKAAGNGGLMRIVPVGLAYANDTVRRDLWAARLTAMTHADLLCQFLSVTYCALVSACVEDMPDRWEAYRTALSHGWERYPAVMPKAKDRLDGVGRLSYGQLRGSGYVLDCFEASVWCFLHRDTPEDAIVAAVNLGDDADTTGAVTGGLVGAYYGFEALPKRWVKRLLSPNRLDDAVRGLIRVATT
ncbi:MAG: ADP-ribosylglycohydrolase family protein [Bacillota bacterium]